MKFMSVFAELHKFIGAIICLETTMDFLGKGDTALLSQSHLPILHIAVIS